MEAGQMSLSQQSLSDAIDALPESERRYLANRLMMQLDNAKQYQLSSFEYMVWNAANHALADEIGFIKQEFYPNRMRGRGGVKGYQERCARIENYITRSCSDLTRISKPILLKRLFRCLIWEMRSWDKCPALKPASLIVNSDNLPVAVDNMYPGYAQARMLQQIVMMRD
jgi:hypothetical protein